VTVPKLFVSNTQPPRPGLIAQRDVVGFDEIAGSAFDAEGDKNLYKSYMENGQINRGTITVAGDAGFVFNGNINYDPRSGQLPSTFSSLCRPRSATTRPSTTAGRHTCRAGSCPS